MKPTHILITLCLICLLLAAPAAAASVTDASGTVYTTYDQIYASTTLSSSEKLSLVQEMAGWTDELAAYVEWKSSGGLEAYQAALSGNSTSSDYGWDEAPGDGFGDGGTNIEPEYSYQERQAYDAAYAAYQAEFAANYAATAAYTGSGSGTEADPYIITTVAEWNSINDDLSAHYKLGNNISIGTTTTTIGSPSSQFTGSIDGDGFGLLDISYTINVNGHIGYFYVKNAIFTNIFFKDITIYNTGSGSESQGSALMRLYDDITITSCMFQNINLKIDKGTYNHQHGQLFNPYADGYSIIMSNCIFDTITASYSKSTSSSVSVTSASIINSVDGSISNIYLSNLNFVAYTVAGIYIWANNYAYDIEISNSVIASGNLDGYNTNHEHRIATFRHGTSQATLTLSNNYALSTIPYTNAGTSTQDGANVDAATLATKSFYQNTLGWDFVNTWYWDDDTNTPQLQAFRASVPPTISAISATPSIGGQQDTYTLSVSASTTAAGGISSYQWYGRIGSSGTWNAINGATSATYQFVPGDQALGDIYFKAVVTGADGGVVDSYDAGYTAVKITIILAPQITSPAATPATGPLTQTVQLSASVTSTETVTYQWQELIGSTWTDISGATSATATVNINDASPTTHSYRLLATNVGGTSTSNTVTYQSVAPPTISTVSANPTTGPLTQSVTLSATVSGATSYQWQQQSGSTWQNIAGATSATYTANIADTAATTHSYRLQATNIGGTTTSATVTYQSVAAPTINTISASPASGPLTQTVTLSATVSGATSYQWQQQSGSTWQNIAGATAATYTVSINDATPTTHTYRLQATNVGGTTTSATVTYTSVAAPTINTISASPASGPLTQTVTLTVSATGASNYQWQEQIAGNWQNIQGATTATYDVSISDSTPTLHTYRVIATNVGGSTTSNTVTYQSSQGPLITNAAANPTTGPLTQSVQLSATVTSDYAITYQWQEQIAGNWQNIQGANAATYTVSINDAAPTLHQYRLLATDIGGTTPSAVVTYQSVAPPVFESVSVTPEQGTYTSTVQLSATVTSDYAITYQWQEQIAGNWQNIQGATTATYSLTLSDQAATLHSYRLQATNVGGTSTSNTVTYQSVAPPVFSSVSVTPTSGAMPLTISFSADASDTSGYRWEYSTGGSVWRQMASGASGSYTFTNEGTYSVRVVATGTGGQTISSVVSVSVVDYTPVFESVSVTPTAGVVPFSVTFTASATNSPDYVWEQRQGNSWVAVGFGSPFTLSIPHGTETGTLSFRAQASNDYGTAVSEVLTVSVGAPPRAEIVAPVDGATAAVNRAVSFSAYSAPGVAYSWSFGDGSSGSGSTVTHYYAEEGMYTVTLTATNQYGSSTDSLHLYVIVPTGEIFVTATDVSSSGVELTATVETTPVDAGTLIWFELESMSGTVVYKSPQLSYSGPVSYTASGLPLMAGESYRAVAYSNYYGYSIPVQVTLVDAVHAPHEPLGDAWNDGLNREPFNVSALVAAGVGVYGGALGGGAAVAFGVIVMFVLVGLWLRQQDIVIPLTLTLIAGWFVIGNLPGDWQPIAYTLMVVCVVAIFFYLFRKRIE